jgi:hypothetical protein
MGFLNFIEYEFSMDSFRYMEFIEKSSQLNDLSNYPQLMERCNNIGYTISKVGFRGYYASPALQAMHDVAITRRTELQAKVILSFSFCECFHKMSFVVGVGGATARDD